jgi:hypothetical protein
MMNILMGIAIFSFLLTKSVFVLCFPELEPAFPDLDLACNDIGGFWMKAFHRFTDDQFSSKEHQAMVDHCQLVIGAILWVEEVHQMPCLRFLNFAAALATNGLAPLVSENAAVYHLFPST